jgi:hypothetical protein
VAFLRSSFSLVLENFCELKEDDKSRCLHRPNLQQK